MFFFCPDCVFRSRDSGVIFLALFNGVVIIEGVGTMTRVERANQQSVGIVNKKRGGY